MLKAYRYKVKPNNEQRQSLLRFAGTRRFVYNLAKELDEQSYAQTGKGLSEFNLNKRLTALKQQPDKRWMLDVNAQLQQAAIRDYSIAKSRFVKGLSGRPTFKSKHRDRPSFRVQQGTKLRDRGVWCPNIGWIKLYRNRLPAAEGVVVKNATFCCDACGDWWVSVLVDEVAPVVVPDELMSHPVGIDLGLISLVMTSDGESVKAPRVYRGEERRLRRRQKALSRRVKGSHRYRKQRRSVARLHRTIRNRRNDVLHKTSRWLIDGHSMVCIEDLNIQGLARTKLAKSMSDAGWGELVRQLSYKAAWSGKPIIRVNRFYPSSKLCSVCGNRNGELRRSDRSWRCANCGTLQDRDLNAATNILHEGMRIYRSTLADTLVAVGQTETINGRGVGVRLSEPVGSYATDGEAFTSYSIPSMNQVY